MIVEYIEAALARANYEIIRDEEPYYGEVPELKGVWATGKTLEECRKKLAEVIEGWIDDRVYCPSRRLVKDQSNGQENRKKHQPSTHLANLLFHHAPPGITQNKLDYFM